MSAEAQISGPCKVARVTHVADDGGTVYLRYANGDTASATGSVDPFDVDDVVLVDAGSHHIELAPDELWKEESAVGVVRVHRDDATVVDASGRLILLETNPVEYRTGNTVEWSLSAGVIRVLDERPIRVFDAAEIDDAVIATFKRKPDPSGPSFEQFGGLERVVERAKQLIEVPMQYRDELTKIGARPIKGVLFTGLPGTGKTMLASIIANRAAAQFYEIRGPEIFSKWVGESELLLRMIFEDAKAQPRSIIFFDEIDSVASRRDDAHEVSRRVVAQLLTEMDGFTPAHNVIVIATTNRPEDIDRALLRPGRFDWEVAFPFPNRNDREAILRVGEEPLATDPDLPHALIAEQTEAWPPAELAAIWSEAALLAVRDGREIIMAEDYVGGFERRQFERRRRLAAERRGDDERRPAS